MNGNSSKRKNSPPNVVVQSVGDSWVLCRSKSRDGHVYYFNTLTGQTAWNLSNEEIERSKNIKKQTSSEPRANTPEEDKEPTKGPMDSEMQCSKSPQQLGKQHNNQINNRVSSNPMHSFAFPGFFNVGAPVCDTTNNFNNLNSLNRINPNLNNMLNPSVNSYSLNGVPAIYNPNIWAVPPTHQIFIAPAVSPLVNHLPTQNIAAPVISNLGGTSVLASNPTRDTALHQRIGNIGQEKVDLSKYKFSKNDLRQRLSVKRNLQYNQASSCMPEAYSSVTDKWQQPSQHYNNKQCFEGDEKTEENEFEDVSRLDLTPLRDLANPNANTDIWYIVVDEDVLLKEFKFLNILTDSDAQCRLMIPHHVMLHIENYVSDSQDVQARRILRFLTQQIRHGDAMLAEESSDSDDESTTNMLLSTCFKLAEENYHLILLTMNNELLRHIDLYPVSIFSPENLKRLLKRNSNKSLFTNTQVSTFTPKRFAKNVSNKSEIINNMALLSTNNKTSELHREVTISPIIQKQSSSKSVIGKSPTQIQSLKITMDAAIQTDFNDLNPNVSFVASENIKKDNTKIARPQNTRIEIDQTREKTENTGICTAIPNNIQTQTGKRKICLKRTIPNEALVTPSTEKRCFKWRRRRNAPSQADVTVSEDINTKTQNQNDLISDTFEEKTDNNTVDNPNQNNLLSNANISTASSDVSVIKQNVSENIIIEETSTSGMISSTLSNIDDNVVNTIDQSDVIPSLTAMYKVDNPDMEEYLKMKCDEWVSRFIQIMEEVLSVVLQLDPPFSHINLPPPWTMHEATQCIKIKFNNNNSIMDAASKLSDIVFKVSDNKGNINMNIKPSEYMEMYSYGVQLLDILKVVVKDCEDLHIATESLKKLLNDIQNPNLECNAHEIFFDVIQDQAINTEIPNKEVEENNPQSCNMDTEQQLTPKKMLNSCNIEEKYNLRSSKKPTLFKNNAELVKSGKNWDTKSSFLSTLKLKKTIGNGNDNIDPIKGKKQIIKVIPNDFQKVENNLMNTGDWNSLMPLNKPGEHNTVSIDNEDYSKNSVLQEDNYNGPSDIENTLSKTNDMRCYTQDVNYLNHSLESVGTQMSSDDPQISKHIAVNEPRIVRNFSKCAEFEERLRQKYKENNMHNENLLDYEDEYITEEYGFEDGYDDIVNDEELTDEVVDNVNNMQIMSPMARPNNNNINKFRYIVAMVLHEIRDAFWAIKTLCEKYFEESKKPSGSKMKKIELQVKAKRAHSHITNLCKSLDSMLSQETNDSNNNIQILMKKSGLDDFEINEDLKEDYSNTISKCKKHAEVFLESIQNIITTLRC